MAYTIPVSNPDITFGGTDSKLPNAHVATKGKVSVQKQLKGDVTIKDGKIQNIYIASYKDLDELPAIKTKVDAQVSTQAAQLKCHVKFL